MLELSYVLLCVIIFWDYMSDVEHLCSHYILVDSVEVVITYIDIYAC
jgi:hypothetical protein